MARFYLNIRKDGVLIPDPEGDEVADLAAAHKLALDTLKDMRRLPHVYGEPAEWEANEFILTDETGAELLTIPFSAPAQCMG